MTNKVFGAFLILFFVGIHSGFGATITVVSNADDGSPGTLRWAISEANLTAEKDTIIFNAAHNITLLSALPTISRPVFIDGIFSGVRVQIDGTNTLAGAGISLSDLAIGSIIKGLNIHSHKGQGILIAASNVFVIGCYIGTDNLGTLNRANGGDGIEIAAGLSNIQIGGSTIDSSNVISGNNGHGINIATACSNIKIFGNKVGISSNGNDALGNGANGINALACKDFIIGGINGRKNVISSNQNIGILISSGDNISIKNNFIGTDINGVEPRGNDDNGIQLEGDVTNIIIGGKRYVEGNIISANGGAGINFQDPNTGIANAHGAIIKGNLIGTNFTGDNSLIFGNVDVGVIIKSNSCIIGGTTNDEGNVIGGSKKFSGILIANGNNNSISGNYIGVGLDGTTPIGNNEDGISIVVETPGLTATNNTVGNNRIAYNNRYGVNIGRPLGPITFPPATPSNAETGNSIRKNKIYCNNQKGIFLYLDIPADQGNNGNPAPIINYAESDGTKIKGTSGPGQTIDIYEIVDCPSCDFNPQGKEWIATVTANGSGNWEYISTLPPGQMLPDQITATATDISNNTSEFSLCCQAIAGFLQGPPEVCVDGSITLSVNGHVGDRIMLQSSPTPDDEDFTNVESKIFSDPIFSSITISDTTYFRVITYSQGSFATAACKDTSRIIRVNAIPKPIPGTATITPSSICEGESFTLNLTGSTGDIQWQRSYRDDNGVFFNIDGATSDPFLVSPTVSQSPVAFQAVLSNGSCPIVFSNLVGGSVSRASSGSISGREEVCNGEDVLLTINGNEGNIQWQDSTEGRTWTDIPDGFISPWTYTPPAVASTSYIRVVVQDWSGTCKDTSSTHTLISDSCLVAPDVVFPNGLTPNGDNQNDVFYIYNIWQYPSNHLTIYNRWGSIVYEADGYANTWDGTHNGNALPVSTYYYVLELGPDKKGNMNDENKYSGSVTIVR